MYLPHIGQKRGQNILKSPYLGVYSSESDLNAFFDFVDFENGIYVFGQNFENLVKIPKFWSEFCQKCSFQGLGKNMFR